MSRRQHACSPARRLAFYLDNFEGGGVQKTMLTLAGALAARGHPVEVLVCRPSGALQDQVPPDVEVVALGEPSAWSARVLALEERSRPSRGDPRRRRPVAATLADPWLSRPARRSARGAPALGAVRRNHAHEPRGRARPPPRRRRHARHRQRAQRAAAAAICSAVGRPCSCRRCSGAPMARRMPWSRCPTASPTTSPPGAAWRAQITTIYNPVATPDLDALQRAPVDHPLVPAGRAAGGHERGPAGSRQGFPDPDPGVRPGAARASGAPGDLRPGQVRGEDDEEHRRLRQFAAELGIAGRTSRYRASSPTRSPTWRAPRPSPCRRSTKACPAS